MTERCDFPLCFNPVADHGMCKAREQVRVSGSFVDDKHADGGHG